MVILASQGISALRRVCRSQEGIVDVGVVCFLDFKERRTRAAVEVRVAMAVAFGIVNVCSRGGVIGGGELNFTGGEDVMVGVDSFSTNGDKVFNLWVEGRGRGAA